MARRLAHKILKVEIANDPKFHTCFWEFESTKVDLSNYATPNLESSDGSKAWLGI